MYGAAICAAFIANAMFFFFSAVDITVSMTSSGVGSSLARSFVIISLFFADATSVAKPFGLPAPGLAPPFFPAMLISSKIFS